MFELTYMHPFTGDIQKENNAENVTMSNMGVAIKMTDKSRLFVPWNRVTGLAAENKIVWEVIRLDLRESVVSRPF